MRELGRVLKHLAREGRWLRSLALVVVFALGCGLLSWWQFSRREETAAANRLITENAAAPAVPIESLLSSTGAWSGSVEWRTVQVTGRYLPEQQLLVRNRVNDDDPGFEVLTPLRLQDGAVLVLDRGWVPVGTTQDRPDSVPAAPVGTVTVFARLQQDEGPIAGRTAPSGEIPSIDLAAVARSVGGPVYTGAYGLVRREDPAVSPTPTRLGPHPASLGTDEGTHLSYAVQWILFALLAFIALFWSIRRDLRDAGDPVVLAADERREIRRRLRGPSDEEAEDAELV